MRQFNVLFRWSWTFLVVVTLGLAGCDGDDGAAGAAGAAGQPGTDGNPGTACWDLNGNGVGDPAEDINGDGLFDAADCGIDPVAAAVEMAKAESCSVCHDGVGDFHQSLYDDYVDASAFEMTITGATVVDGAAAGTFDATLNVTILKNGVPFTDLDTLFALEALDPPEAQALFIVVQYDSVNDQYLNGRQYFNDGVTMVTPGNYELLATGISFDPRVSDGQYYGYIAQTPLFTKLGDIGGEIATGSHVDLYDDIANAALPFGAAGTDYVSAANVGGCVKCHGAPYLKHGFRAAEVAGLPDFAACKSCHYTGRSGFLSALQWQADDPLGWATDAARTADYTYEGSILNDTHMAHAMEFPYPQSMANCSTCHGALMDDAGVMIPGTDKLAQVLTDANFTPETCKSCHAVRGIGTWAKTYDAAGDEVLDSRGRSMPEKYYQGNRPPALEYLWKQVGYVDLHQAVLASTTPDCNLSCHKAGGFAPPLSAYHSGYDSSIYDATGTKYADLKTISIDLVTWDAMANTLKIDFSANDPAIVPEVLVSFYGWDSKNFIVPSHARDGSERCPSSRGNGCRFEWETGSTNPLFSDFAEINPGEWTVTANLAEFQANETDDILMLIADNVVKKAEITITPELDVAGTAVVLEAVDQTIDLTDGLVVPAYFKGANSTVEITKCNACHDALASSFHDGRGRAGDGIEVCKNCHNPTFAGSHIEMASRSIDSYVHAIHSFQDFDVDDTFEAFDPVFARRYDQHVGHVFPNFTIRNCEACHRAGTYNAPDQSQSMPGLLSASSDVATWYELVGDAALEDSDGRNIGTVAEAVTGPASRACGGCHRARLVRDDAAGDLAAFNAHTEAFGTYVENDSASTADDPADEILFGIIDKIMGMFQ